MRDGYAGYTHLIDAHHAWSGAYLLRDLRAFHSTEPDQQLWAAAMTDTLCDAHGAAQTARAAGASALDPELPIGLHPPHAIFTTHDEPEGLSNAELSRWSESA